MSTDNSILGQQTFSPPLRSPGSSKSSVRHSSNGSNASLPTIVEVPEDVVTQRDPYVKTGFRGVLESPYCTGFAILAAIGGFALGYNQGLMPISLITEQIVTQFPQIDLNFIAAITQLGGFLGALIMGSVADHCARKRSIGIAAVVFISGFVFQTISMNYTMLVVARLVGGIAIGMLSVITPIYISEISPPEIRGSLLVFTDVLIALGTMASFWISVATGHMDGEEIWRLPFVFLVIPGLILGIGAICMPFSPRWLASRFENQQALYCLSKLRQLCPDNCKVQNEWMEIRVEVAYQREITEARHPLLQDESYINGIKLELQLWLDCFKSRYWYRTHVGIGMMFFQQFVGMKALAYNVPILLGTLGASIDIQIAMPGIFAAVHLLGALTCLWTIDTFGRKRVLVSGSSLMLVCLIIIAGLNSKFSDNWSSHPDAGWCCVGISILCILAFGAGWSPVSWALPSEVFPSTLRVKGGALSACSYWLYDFLSSLITRSLFSKSKWGTYAFFAGFCLLSAFWAAHFVPETTGRALEEMYKLFGDNEEHVREGQKKTDIRRTLASEYAPELFISPGGTPTNGFRIV